MKFARGLMMAFAAAVVAFALPAQAQKTELLVYTALETDQLKAYEEAFYKAVPDVSIKWVRDSTGVITAKLVAEKANPQADVIWGLAATSLLIMEADGMLQAYAPTGLAQHPLEGIDQRHAARRGGDEDVTPHPGSPVAGPRADRRRRTRSRR